MCPVGKLCAATWRGLGIAHPVPPCPGSLSATSHGPMIGVHSDFTVECLLECHQDPQEDGPFLPSQPTDLKFGCFWRGLPCGKCHKCHILSEYPAKIWSNIICDFYKLVMMPATVTCCISHLALSSHDHTRAFTHRCFPVTYQPASAWRAETPRRVVRGTSSQSELLPVESGWSPGGL